MIGFVSDVAQRQQVCCSGGGASGASAPLICAGVQVNIKLEEFN